jgi:hypothetical protein
VTTTLPRWRFVPLASTLLICSGLFMLQQSTSAPSARPISRDNACDGVTPGPPQSISTAVNHEDPDSPGDDDDDAPTGSDAAMAAGERFAARLDGMSGVIEVSADPRPFRPLDRHLVRGPPNRPDPDDVDVVDDDDDKDDDDDDGRTEDHTVPPATTRHHSRVFARVEFLRASFTTSGQSLRAPPQ